MLVSLAAQVRVDILLADVLTEKVAAEVLEP